MEHPIKRLLLLCPDFSLWSKPDRSCKVCRGEFYGEQCFMAHLIKEEVVDKDLEKIKRKLEQDLGGGTAIDCGDKERM